MKSGDEPRGSALVTGAARGIGRATVEALAADGWHVFAGVRDPAALVPFDSGRVHVLRLDVTVEEEIRAAIDSANAQSEHGGLACVVNNAGWSLFGAVEDVDLDTARREFETNFFGAVRVIQSALPAMRRARGGVIVNVSTVVGRLPLPLFGLYGASKLALAAVSDALAIELRGAGVRVVHLEAGIVDTEFAKATIVSGQAGSSDPPYGPMRDAVLGRLRSLRASDGLSAAAVAATIVRSIADPRTPVRVVLPDGGLRPLEQSIGGPSDEAHRLSAEFFGLPSAGEHD